MNDTQINAIVDAVVRRLSNELGTRSSGAAPQRAPAFHRGRKGVFDDLDGATAAARVAFERWGDTPVAVREKVVEAMREVTRRSANELAEMAVAETGLG